MKAEKELSVDIRRVNEKMDRGLCLSRTKVKADYDMTQGDSNLRPLWRDQQP